MREKIIILVLITLFNMVKTIEEKSYVQVDYFVDDDCSAKVSDTGYFAIDSAQCIKAKYDDVECSVTTDEK